MEQIVIERKQTRFIYLIKDTNIQFYLVIPNNNKVSLVLNIMENVNDELVKNIPDFNDKVIVIPVFNSNIINYLKTTAPEYNQADNYFSSLINIAYKILTHNKMIVDPTIYLNNNQIFTNFNNYFVNKFKGRIVLTNLTKEIIKNNIPENLNISVSNNIEEKQELPKNLDDIYNEEITLKSDKTPKTETTKKEPGFVSYVLLGVMIAVLSLVFLYMLL